MAAMASARHTMGRSSWTPAAAARLAVIVVTSIALPADAQTTVVAHFPAPGVAAAAAPVPPINPLAPIDTSSPRATLHSFREAVDRIFACVRKEGAAAQRRPEHDHLVRNVLSCLDLTNVPSSLLTSEGSQAAVCLKEVLDRIPLPALADIPDAAAVQAGGLKRWRLPGTEIWLVRIAEGNREGDFVFSTDTVSRAKRFYDRARSLPYRADAGSPGLLDRYVEAGGWMIPEALIKSLPAWAHVPVFGETPWQWTATALLAALAIVAAVKAWRLMRTLSQSHCNMNVASLVFPATVVAVSLAADYLLTFQIRLTGDNLLAAKVVLHVTTLAGVVAGVMVLMSWLCNLLIEARGMRQEGIETQLIRLGGKVLTFVVVAWIVIQAADSLGLPVTPLVAGLGAGGLAVALASQYTVENLIAGLVIFADKPVRIGDECLYGSIRGRVEQIGLRSTRIRGEDRTLISVPNAEFAKQQLVNFSQRDHIPLRIPLSLAAGMPPRRLRALLARLRQVLVDHPRLANKPVDARLTAQSSDALTVELSAMALTEDDQEFAAIREDVLLTVMEIVQDATGQSDASETSRSLRAA
jgi:MscS family membrane protein